MSLVYHDHDLVFLDHVDCYSRYKLIETNSG